MTLPRWLARFNRRVMNPRGISGGRWPVLVHTGRRSGKTHRTPIAAYPFDRGYLFTLNYGAESDWARNVVAAGRAGLEIDGERVELTHPRILPAREGYGMLPPGTRTPPGWVGVEECLVVERA